MKIVRFIFSIGCLMLAILLVSCNKENHRQKIVLFTSFPEHSLPFQRIKTDLNNEYSSKKYAVYVHPANVEDSTNLDEKENFKQIRQKMEICLDTMYEKPDVIILFGDLVAHAAAGSRYPMLRTTPAVCLHITYPSYQSLLPRRHNFVVYQSPLTVKENLNYIANIEKFVATAIMLDSTYLDNHTFELMMDQLERDKSRYAEDHHDMSDVEEPELHYLRMNNECFPDNAMEENIGLYYTVNPEVFNLKYISALHGCLGGYITPISEMFKQSHPVIDALLDGENAQRIGWQKHHCDYWLDWRNARQLHPYAEDFPRYTHFVNLPWQYRSRLHMFCYKMMLPAGVLLLLLIIVFIPTCYVVLDYRQRKGLLDQGKKAKETDEQLQSILASIKAYPFHITQDYHIVLPKTLKEFGIKDRPLPLDVVLRMLAEPTRSELWQFVHNPSDSQEMQREAIYYNYKEPEEHTVLIQLTRHKQDDIKYIFSGLYIFNDEEHQIDAELKEALRRSEELTAKESFLAAMGHEIRTPLNAIAGFSHVLLQHNKDLTEQERATYGEYIIQSNNEMLRLMDQVMNYSREKGDHFQIELSRHNVADLVENLYVIHSVIVPNRLTFDLRRGPSEIEFMVNKTSLYQIVSNLINNAIKFTEQGGITLGWEVVETEHANEQAESLKYVIIYVQDTGIGIAPTLQKRIFDRYFKENNHTVGAGIGLSLCKELVTQMGGTILIKSKEGEGSRFEVILPLLPVTTLKKI